MIGDQIYATNLYIPHIRHKCIHILHYIIIIYIVHFIHSSSYIYIDINENIYIYEYIIALIHVTSR